MKNAPQLRRIARRLAMVFLAALLCGLPAAAQSLGLVPAEVDLNFEKGKTFQFDLAVSNNGDQPVAAKVNVTDFWYDRAFQKTFTAPGTSPRSAANWVEVVPRQVEVPAHGSVKVKVIVTPPASAEGGYYATVFVESRPELVQDASAANNNKAVFANVRLGSLILLNAKKTGNYKAEITGAKLIPGDAHRDLQVTFDAANTGNTHIFPQPRLAILDSQHQLIARAEGPLKRLLPGERQAMKVSWSGSLEPGNYTALLTVSYGPDQVFTQELPFTLPDEARK